MGYLICLKCGGYYKLEEDESKDDFVSCECYGPLTYVDSIDDYLKENNKLNKDISENKKNEFSDVEVDHNIILDVFFPDSHLKNGFGDESTQKKKLSKPPSSFPSFSESRENLSVKNRNYYREINSKDIKPDIRKLKLIKDINGIIEALYYNDTGIKLEAVQALGALGDERALEHLDKLRRGKKGILKTYAENAIFHIESKNKGLKSKNRAYYQEEYHKEITRKNNEKKLIDQSSKPIDQTSLDQTINKIKEKTAVETSNIIKSNILNNSTSKAQNISKTKETKTIQKTTKIPAKTDGKISGNADGNFPRLAEGKVPGKNHNGESKTKKISKQVVPPEFVKKEDLLKKATQKIDDTKRINTTKGTGHKDVYFIQFLGIKKTDKPLILFIFLFTAILVIGVLLTMSYR